MRDTSAVAARPQCILELWFVQYQGTQSTNRTVRARTDDFRKMAKPTHS